jgi:hypothetical protein
LQCVLAARILIVDFVVCTLAVKKKKSGQVSTCRIGPFPCKYYPRICLERQTRTTRSHSRRVAARIGAEHSTETSPECHRNNLIDIWFVAWVRTRRNACRIWTEKYHYRNYDLERERIPPYISKGNKLSVGETAATDSILWESLAALLFFAFFYLSW